MTAHLPFRTGDCILHKPTGETWVCAWADPETGYLSWLGWPPNGAALIADCELARAATDEEHRKALRDLKASARRDAGRALRLYGDPDVHGEARLMPEIPTLLAQPAPERFEGAIAWSKLSADAQGWIGAIALELVLTWRLLDREGPGPESGLSPLLTRVASASDRLLMHELEAAVIEALPEGAFTAGDGSPRIPFLLGGVCRVCGCSQNDACDEDCGWAAEDLCTACVAGGHDHG